MLIYPVQDITLGHSTSGSNGYSVLSDTNDSSYIYQSVTTNDFVTLDSTFKFDTITLSNMNINSVSAVVRMQTTGSEGVNMSYMQVIGNTSNPKYFSDPTYNNFTDCSFTLAIGDIGVSNSTITTSETYNNIQLTLETKVKKTISSKPNFEIQISEFYIVIDYTSTETGNNENENNQGESTTTRELSKIKLNGIIYNFKDTVSRNAVAPSLATQSSDGLMSSTDKRVLDNLNPNVTVTISNNTTSEIHFINAKEENLVNLVGVTEPIIGSQTRTSNLLNVNIENPTNAYINGSGTITSSGNDILGDFIEVSSGDVIYYTGIVGETTASSVNRRLHVYDSNQRWIQQLNYAGGLKVGNSWSTYGTIPSNGAYVRVSWGITDTNVMITVGAPTKYEPYYIITFDTFSSMSIYVAADAEHTNPNTYTFNIPAAAGDVYGFKYNPILGKIWVDMGHIASYNGENLTTRWWSDRDIYMEGTSPQTGAEVLYILDDEDVVEYNITPISIPMLYHSNYVYVNNGILTDLTYSAETLAVTHLTIYDGVSFGETNIFETDVQHWQDTYNNFSTKADLESPIFTGTPIAPTPGNSENSTRLATTAFVQRTMNNIAPVESSTKATKNYTIGEYLMNRGQLYKVTDAIASGVTLTVGTNIEATDVATELNLLFSQIS